MPWFLQSYAGGRDLWGLADTANDSRKGWRQPIFNDGLIEVGRSLSMLRYLVHLLLELVHRLGIVLLSCMLVLTSTSSLCHALTGKLYYGGS